MHESEVAHIFKRFSKVQAMGKASVCISVSKPWIV